ncbi:MAG: helix-turn-helix domain-containing protein [bacterium]
MPHDTNAPQRPISSLLEEFGERLEAYRIARNIKQADLAEQAGISRATLARIEAGQSGTIDSVLRLLRALDIEERLLAMVPDARRSPLDPASDTGVRRQRVRTSNSVDDSDPWSWDEDAP